MMDNTGMSVLAHSGAWIAALLVCVFAGYKALRYLLRMSSPKRKKSDVRRFKFWSVSFALLGFLSLFLVGQESSYRSKTVISNPAQSEINEQMREVDEALPPEIQPAESMSPIGQGVEMLEKNATSGEASKKAFSEIKTK